jgi:hypothetical protein
MLLDITCWGLMLQLIERTTPNLEEHRKVNNFLCFHFYVILTCLKKIWYFRQVFEELTFLRITLRTVGQFYFIISIHQDACISQPFFRIITSGTVNNILTLNRNFSGMN